VPIDRPSVGEAIEHVRARIREAALRSSRRPEDILLVAVTKTVPAEVVRLARECGVEDFAENYAGQLAAKATAVPATWHFVGRVQTGTAPRVADHAEVIHSAEPGRGLERVAGRAARSGRELRALAQVDFTGHRHGVAPEDAGSFVERAASLDGIRLVGLMTLPPWAEDPEASRPWFARLRELRDRLSKRWPELTELSMGMSADYGVAIEEGATMVRVGTALFGPRHGPGPRAEDDPGGGPPG
jgi:PLP dependent protein